MDINSGALSLEPEFVGEGRRLLVEGLVAAYDKVNQSGQPCWISLEAPSGVGKTRTVREFYAALAAQRQPEPAYWPATILGSRPVGFDDVSARRKQVHPLVEHVPGSLPSFFWWGITASLRSGITADALAEDLAQIKAHEKFLDDSWGKITTWTERNPGWWKKPSNAVVEEGINHAVEVAFDALAGTVVPGLGLVRPAIEKLREVSKNRAESQTRLASDEQIALSSFDVVEETFSLLSKLAIPGLPMVIFIEDFHAADLALAELIAKCAESNSAILIITTSWPGHGEQRDHIRAVLERTQSLRICVDSEANWLPAPFPEGASLAPLAPQDLASIVRYYYPRVDPDTLGRLTRRYSNPLALELFCTIERYRRKFPDGDLKLSSPEIDKLPRSIEDLYRSIWEELPKVVREALVYASLGVPVSVHSSEEEWELSWHRPLLIDALTTLDRPDAGELAQALTDPASSSAWARELSKSLRSFHEIVQWQIALGDDEFLFEEDREDFFKALAAAVERSLYSEVEGQDPQEQTTADLLYRARLSLTLFEKGLLNQDVLADAVHAAQWALKGSPLDLPVLIKLGEQTMGALEPKGSTWCRVAAEFAYALSESGRRYEAARQHEQVIAARTFEGGWDDPQTIAVRLDHAKLVSRYVDSERGVEVYQQLSEDTAQIAGLSEDLVTEVQVGLAEAMIQANQWDRAIPLLAALLESQEQASPPNEVLIGRLRNELAQVYFHNGRAQDALSLLTVALDQTIEALGKSDPAALVLRSNIAEMRALMGLIDSAIAMFEPLVADTVEVYGEVHPHSTTVRVGLALAYQTAGMGQASVELLAHTYTTIREDLGPGHPELGQVQFALLTVAQQEAQWEFLVPYLEGELLFTGEDHMSAQTTAPLRTVLAQAHAMLGNLEVALEVCEQGIALLGKYEEKSHAFAVELISLKAQIQFLSGRQADAISELEALVELCESTYGPDHGRILSLRETLSEMRDA